MAWTFTVLGITSRRRAPRPSPARWLASLLAAVAVACGATVGMAATVRIVDLNQFQQQDLRALSMGNAFGSAARGEAALQYNPAGLANYDLDLKADFSATFMEAKGNFINDTTKVSSGTPTPTDINNYLQKYSGTTQTFLLQTFTSAVANLGEFHLGVGGAGAAFGGGPVRVSGTRNH